MSIPFLVFLLAFIYFAAVKDAAKKGQAKKRPAPPVKPAPRRFPDPPEARPSAPAEVIPAQEVSEEGESEAEHRAHMEKTRAEEQMAARAEQAQQKPAVTREELRRAVVMSEVLGKPVSLRGRR